MAARSFTAQDLIALPSLSASETIAMVKQLETRTAEAKLSADLTEALAEVSALRDALVEAQTKKLAQSPTSSADAVEADRNLDRAWGSTNDWLGAWTRLGDPDYAAHAETLTSALFPDGVSFINLPYLGEWTESDLRVRTIKDKKLEPHFKALGGEVYLKAIKTAHDAYGKALGVTENAKGPAPVPPDVRAAIRETHDAMREYVAKVMATVSKRKPKSAEFAALLLEPITSRETRRRKTAGTMTPATPAAPGSASAPGSSTPGA
jgi:hypothetical protein